MLTITFFFLKIFVRPWIFHEFCTHALTHTHGICLNSLAFFFHFPFIFYFYFQYSTLAIIFKSKSDSEISTMMMICSIDLMQKLETVNLSSFFFGWHIFVYMSHQLVNILRDSWIFQTAKKNSFLIFCWNS